MASEAAVGLPAGVRRSTRKRQAPERLVMNMDDGLLHYEYARGLGSASGYHTQESEDEFASAPDDSGDEDFPTPPPNSVSSDEEDEELLGPLETAAILEEVQDLLDMRCDEPTDDDDDVDPDLTAFLLAYYARQEQRASAENGTDEEEQAVLSDDEDEHDGFLL